MAALKDVPVPMVSAMSVSLSVCVLDPASFVYFCIPNIYMNHYDVVFLCLLSSSMSQLFDTMTRYQGKQDI